ncbi:MAG: LON peptidase substrate-binding domain-containing protein, partial [Eikenella corrodens]
MTQSQHNPAETRTLPMLPLRDVVVYPHMVLPLFVGRPKSIAALDAAIEQDGPVFLLAQKNPANEDPSTDDLHTIGTLANILQVLKLPDGTVKVLVEGMQRARALAVN